MRWFWTGLATTGLMGALVCMVLAGSGERILALVVWSRPTTALPLALAVALPALCGGAVLAFAGGPGGRRGWSVVAYAGMLGTGGTLLLLALLAAAQSGRATAVAVPAAEAFAGALTGVALFGVVFGAALVRALFAFWPRGEP